MTLIASQETSRQMPGAPLCPGKQIVRHWRASFRTAVATLWRGAMDIGNLLSRHIWFPTSASGNLIASRQGGSWLCGYAGFMAMCRTPAGAKGGDSNDRAGFR